MIAAPARTLAAIDVRARYRDNEVLHGISLLIEPGKVTALLGHNGAGKTTLLRTLYGLHALSGGSVYLGSTPLPSGDTAARTREGVALVPQTRNIFASLTVTDNLRMARELGPPIEEDLTDFIFDLFPMLKERPNLPAGSLSGGQRQMLGVSLALLKRPKILMLDEPSLGIAPNLVERLMENLARIRDSLGAAILLVDQAIRSAIEVADYVYIMKMGRLVVSSPAADLRGSENLWEFF